MSVHISPCFSLPSWNQIAPTKFLSGQCLRTGIKVTNPWYNKGNSVGMCACKYLTLLIWIFCSLWLKQAHCLGLCETPLTTSNQSYHHQGKFRTVEVVNWPLVGKTAVTAVTGADSPVGPATDERHGGHVFLPIPPLHMGAQARWRSLQPLPLLSWPRTHFMLHVCDSVVASPLYFTLYLLCPPPPHISFWPQFYTLLGKQHVSQWAELTPLAMKAWHWVLMYISILAYISDFIMIVIQYFGNG